MKVMVCHDGSENAQKALEEAVKLFGCVKPEVVLITVVEEPLDATSVDEESFEKWRATRADELKKAAEWVAGHGLSADAILAVGDPRKMILEAADSKVPDVLVVARRGAGVLQHMVLGSVSAYLVRHARCPVLITHG